MWSETVETTKCELERLGKDAGLHEMLKNTIDKSFENTRTMGYPGEMMIETKELLRDFVSLRNLHNLPNDGSCANCLGNKCHQPTDVI